jgi:hypothetical protein
MINWYLVGSLLFIEVIIFASIYLNDFRFKDSYKVILSGMTKRKADLFIFILAFVVGWLIPFNILYLINRKRGNLYE